MTKSATLLIQGGRVVLPNHVVELDLLLANGRIHALLEPASSQRVFPTQELDTFDAGGLLIFPGVIDTHVHFETGSSHCDTLVDAANAAALGGTTTMLGHVSSDTDLLKEIQRQREAVVNCPIDVAFHAIITPNQDPFEIIPELTKQGIQSFKFFMAYQNRGLGMDDTQLYEAFCAVAEVGGIALVHAEVDSMISVATQEMINRQATDFTDYSDSRPSTSEVEAIRRAIWLARQSGTSLYIVHVSTPEGLDLIHQCRREEDARHPRVYAETCPKYLLLNREAYGSLQGKGVVAPPLRSIEEQADLIQAFYQGRFDALGSDHSPHALELKTGSSFLEVRPGAPGAQTFFPVMLDTVLPRGDQSQVTYDKLMVLQHATAAGPAKIFNLFPKKGHIGAGADADLVFIDPNCEWRVQKHDLRSNVGYSLYEGNTLRGQPVHSMVRGRWVMRDRALVSKKGGQYLGRKTC